MARVPVCEWWIHFFIFQDLTHIVTCLLQWEQMAPALDHQCCQHIPSHALTHLKISSKQYILVEAQIRKWTESSLEGGNLSSTISQYGSNLNILVLLSSCTPRETEREWIPGFLRRSWRRLIGTEIRGQMRDTNHRPAQNCRASIILISTGGWSLSCLTRFPFKWFLQMGMIDGENYTGWSLMLHFLHFAETPKFLQ